ncbi:hypothetical protein [Halalkalicoccus jeotgali]|uniref:Uncharacterized protein n=1 Tax=Halalkalicoccus jeotgali (strain DSM 18796 / CECT 7217 / JCM 14584 / KCTC 4019 / B3) TaxID=795797 RepID=D8JAJ9_HALJB|nr:hypothetical protein [Halalkalicoccus jeotgali]ADJ14721.1 hypothetical protein HacjB3_06660 [Halalkalicoccus jeotgali B3]ELY39517.1 hypothetical protein C497_05062 [Halalkalicoccus jeotgali B3]
MSVPSIHTDNTSGCADPEQPTDHASRFDAAALARPVEAVAFWSAIALPFLYLPLLVSGLGSTAQLTAFLALLAVHAASIVGGHRYNRR